MTFKRRQVIEIAIGAKSDAAPERFTCACNTAVERPPSLFPAERQAKYSLPAPSGPHCVRGMSLETKLLREGKGGGKRRNLRPFAVGFNKHDRHRSTLLPKRRRRRRFSFQAIGGSEASERAHLFLPPPGMCVSAVSENSPLRVPKPGQTSIRACCKGGRKQRQREDG